MLNEDSDSLQCDLAETYHLYDMRTLPVRTVAVFSYGLGENSRIKKLLSGQRVSLEIQLLASIADSLNLLLWTRAKEGTEKPKSILSALIESDRDGYEGFETPEAFEERRKQLIEGGGADG